MNRNKQHSFIIRYIVAGAFLAVIFMYLMHKDYFTLLKKISIIDMSVSLAIGAMAYIISGFQYRYLLFKNSNTSLNYVDIAILPITMGLWGYIIPIQGGFVYSIALLKAKYKVSISDGTSISIYSYLVSIFLTGIIGLYFTFINKLYFSLISIVSIVFIFSPILIIVLNVILKHIPFIEKFRILKKIQSITYEIINNTTELWKDLKMTLTVFFLNILHILVSIVWYYWAAVVFKLSLPLIAIVMLTLIMRISLILRFTPGNLGVEQLISGGVLVLLGGNGGEGILISLFITLTTIILTFTVGSIGTIYNMKYFKVKGIKPLINSLKN